MAPLRTIWLTGRTLLPTYWIWRYESALRQPAVSS
jgi:hypothetical protein